MFKTINDIKQLFVPVVLALTLGTCLYIGNTEMAETILVAFIAVMTDNSITK